MNFSAALPTFVVTLREGFEAALVVGIVLACLHKAKQTSLARWVYLGVGAGLFASLMVGLLLGGLLQGLASAKGAYTPVIKESLAGTFGIVAIGMLSWMLVWMTKQAKSVKSEVEGTIRSALVENGNAARAIFLLIFIAVLREGFETVLFIVAKFQAGWQMSSLGAIGGLTTAAAIGFLLFRWGVKINIRLFFQVMGIFLLLIVGGLVVGVLKDFDVAVATLARLDSNYANLCFSESGSCILGARVWDASEFLPDKEFPGIVLKSLFGYRQTLYLAQAIAYLGFLLAIGGIYFQSLTGQSQMPSKKKVSAS